MRQFVPQKDKTDVYIQQVRRRYELAIEEGKEAHRLRVHVATPSKDEVVFRRPVK